MKASPSLLAALLLAAPSASAQAADVAVTLAPGARFFRMGQPVPVKLSIENRGKASLALPNAALFGLGMKVTAADGVVHAVPESAVPSAARLNALLPAGTTLATTIDLAQVLPAAVARHGALTVTMEVAGATSEPLGLQLGRDWSRWHALVETEFGGIELEFFPDAAPVTVDNFLSLVEKGFYDGLLFHRVVKGFMVQGGDPNGDGTGNSGRSIPFERSGVKHERGVLSMARGSDFNSASCQFFICHQDQARLDNNYAAFGRVVRGIEVVDQMVEVPCVMTPNSADRVPSRPKDRVVIRKIGLVPPAGTAGKQP